MLSLHLLFSENEFFCSEKAFNSVLLLFFSFVAAYYVCMVKVLFFGLQPRSEEIEVSEGFRSLCILSGCVEFSFYI